MRRGADRGRERMRSAVWEGRCGGQCDEDDKELKDAEWCEGAH